MSDDRITFSVEVSGFKGTDEEYFEFWRQHLPSFVGAVGHYLKANVTVKAPAPSRAKEHS
jgi:hypothetical protein